MAPQKITARGGARAGSGWPDPAALSRRQRARARSQHDDANTHADPDQNSSSTNSAPEVRT
eukprot:3332553-Pleurochrysis_carterae.AAC.4